MAQPTKACSSKPLKSSIAGLVASLRFQTHMLLNLGFRSGAMNEVFIFAALLGTATGLFAQTLPTSDSPASVSVRAIAREDGSRYVGAERCRSCHKAEFLEFGKTVHADLRHQGNSVTGCETCHGPGAAHAEGEEAAHGDDAKTAAAARLIFSFRENAKKNSARCLECHQSSKDQSRFDHSTHMLNGVSCSDCHATHLTAAAENPKAKAVQSAQAKFMSVPTLPEENRWLHNSLLKKSQPELCYQCHANVRGAFALPQHHRVPEGAMKCTDCHATHGSDNRASMVKTNWETCVACHTEKRGPFVFEHASVKVEGCAACHTPHGSTNKALLARREERMLCLQCHVSPSATNVPHSRLSFQTESDCSRCHVQIHGSSSSQYFLN